MGGNQPFCIDQPQPQPKEGQRTQLEFTTQKGWSPLKEDSHDPKREVTDFKPPKTSPSSAQVAAMRSMQEQNFKTKIHRNTLETPLKFS